jgi:hypothetical protein
MPETDCKTDSSLSWVVFRTIMATSVVEVVWEPIAPHKKLFRHFRRF